MTPESFKNRPWATRGSNHAMIDSRRDGEPASTGSRFIGPGKVLAHWDRLTQIHAHGGCVPICVEVYPTGMCMHRCSHCSSRPRRDQQGLQHLDSGRLKMFLAGFAKAGGKAVLWSGGGEPTCYRCPRTGETLRDLLLFTRRTGLLQGLYTNGEALDEALTDTALDACAFVRFSLDAFCAATYRRVHGVAGFESVISRLLECLRRKRAGRAQTTVGVSFVITPRNARDLVLFDDWVSGVQPDYVYFRPEDPVAGKQTTPKRSQIKLHEACARLAATHRATAVIVAHEKFRSLASARIPGRSSCYVGLLMPTLAEDGRLFTCCHTVGNDRHLIGDISNVDPTDLFKKARVLKADELDECPVNCRGEVINADVVGALQLIDNPHASFL